MLATKQQECAALGGWSEEVYPLNVRKILSDFQAFALRGNVVDFVMAVVIGGALGRIITACVDGLLMPVLTAWTHEAQWEHWSFWNFRIGMVLSAGVDFMAKTAVMYLLLIKGVGALLHRDGGALSQAPQRACPFCKESIHAEASRCRHCGSEVPTDPVPRPARREAACTS